MIKKSDIIMSRNFIDSDFNFIIATWIQGLYHGNDFFQMIDKDIYFVEYHKVLEKLIPSCLFKIACLKDEPTAILSYAAFSKKKNTLHWVYTKESWRQIGVAKAIIPETIHQFSHFTNVGLSAFSKKKWSFNPFNLGD
jgi:hypothetical protein